MYAMDLQSNVLIANVEIGIHYADNKHSILISFTLGYQQIVDAK